MKILTEIRDSVYNPQYYKSLLTGESLGSAVKYLAKLSLLASLVGIIIFSFHLSGVFSVVKDTASKIAADYPENLVVSIKDGVASVNQPEPYLVPVDKFIKDIPTITDKTAPTYKNLIVINTKTPFSLEQFKTYSTIGWLTKTELVTIKDSIGQLQIVPLAKVKSLEINKAWVLEKEAFFFKILPWLLLAITLVVYIAFFAVNFVGSLLILFLYALLIWLMAKIKRVELSYKNSYKIGIHAMTFLVILGLFNVFFTPLNNFFFKLVVFLILVYLNFFKSDKSAIA